jgi:hypothetical protein
MAFHQFRQIKVPPNEEVTSKNINDVQNNIAQAISQILGKDQLDSNIITNFLLLENITNHVPHGLGRKLQGFYIIRNHGGYSHLVRDLQDLNLSPNLTLDLTTEIQITVDILCF